MYAIFFCEEGEKSFFGFLAFSVFSVFFLGLSNFFLRKIVSQTLSLSLVKTNKRTHAHTKAQTKEESARAPLAGYATTMRGSLANARGKESVVAANST